MSTFSMFQFVTLSSEVKSMLKSTLNFSNIQEVVSGLLGHRPEQTEPRWRLVQASLESYERKLDGCYPLYRDCVQPHLYGIRLVGG